MKIKSTVYPEHPLSQNEWMEKYRVSTRVNKHDGLVRAKYIMEQWQEGKVESIWESFIKQIKVAYNR